MKIAEGSPWEAAIFVDLVSTFGTHNDPSEAWIPTLLPW